MGSGGHARSGPAPTEGSRTSDRKGLTFSALPPSGYAGKVPDFPLPSPSKRELDVWSESWATPQAHAWSLEPWRIQTVAEFVRLKVRCEDPEAGAALFAQLRGYRDELGLSSGGLARNGWKIADPKPAEPEAEAPSNVTSIKDRVRAANR